MSGLFQLVFDALVLGIAIRTPGLSHLYIEAKIRDFNARVYKKGVLKLPGSLFSRLHVDFIGIDVELMILGAREVRHSSRIVIINITVPNPSSGYSRLATACHEGESARDRPRIHSASRGHSARHVRPSRLPVSAAL